VLLREIDADFRYSYVPPAQSVQHPTAGTVTVHTWRSSWPAIRPSLLGAHQAHNAAVALASLDALAERGMTVDRHAAARSLQELAWPARVEVFGERPRLVIDGAHNVASAAALAETLQTCFPPSRRTLVFGTTREKDLPGQLRMLLPLFDAVIATRYVENPRSVAPAEIAATVEALGGPVCWLASDPAEALAAARRVAAPEGLICVTGSLFLAAETRALIVGQETQLASKPLVC